MMALMFTVGTQSYKVVLRVKMVTQADCDLRCTWDEESNVYSAELEYRDPECGSQEISILRC